MMVAARPEKAHFEVHPILSLKPRNWQEFFKITGLSDGCDKTNRNLEVKK